jgi:hypothetical protein
MANVTIYPVHREMLDALVTSKKAGSIAAGTKTGPFDEMRNAYVFAVSVGFALGRPTAREDMPTSKAQGNQIPYHIFSAAPGAVELELATVFTEISHPEPGRSSLIQGLERLGEDEIVSRVAVLDRYAHAGFSWLAERFQDEGSVQNLLLSTLCELKLAPAGEVTDSAAVSDPLADLMDFTV